VIEAVPMAFSIGLPGLDLRIGMVLMNLPIGGYPLLVG